MSSDNQKLKIREVINLTNYKLNIRKDFINFLESTYGSQKHRLYLFSRIESNQKIFLLHHTGSTVSFPLRFPNLIAIPLHIMLSVGSSTSSQSLWTSARYECMNLETTRNRNHSYWESVHNLPCIRYSYLQRLR